MEKVVSAREIQRNYRKLVNQAKRTKQPVFLGKYNKPEAVLLGMESFEELRGYWRPRKSRRSWEEVKKSLEWIAKGGKKNTNLAKFIHDDRQSH